MQEDIQNLSLGARLWLSLSNSSLGCDILILYLILYIVKLKSMVFFGPNHVCRRMYVRAFSLRCPTIYIDCISKPNVHQDLRHRLLITSFTRQPIGTTTFVHSSIEPLLGIDLNVVEKAIFRHPSSSLSCLVCFQDRNRT